MTPSLKQKTLTQYDFASSFNEESVVELSDASDVENLEKIEDTDEAEKENIGPSSSKRRRSPKSKRAPLQRLSDEEQDANEEPRVPDTDEDEEEQDGDEGPVVRKRRRVGFAGATAAAVAERTNRRRTLGEEHRMSTMKESSRASRRRTLGDSPLAGSSRSRYHTQTLTQFMGRRPTSFVADSDDEELGGGGAENDGFLEWLGGDEPQSPSMDTQASKRGVSAAAAAAASAAAAVPEIIPVDHSPSPHRRSRRKSAMHTTQPSREESVVPQTPVKSIRFDLPPATENPSPSPSRIAALYGAPNKYISPSSKRQKKIASPAKPLTELTGKPTKRMSPAKKPELVIEDSYATEGGFSSVGGTQLRHPTPSQTQTEVFSTPAEEMAATSAMAAQSIQADKPTESDEQPLPVPPQTQTQDGQGEEQFYGALSQIVEDSAAPSQQPLPETPKPATRSTPTATDKTAAINEREIPDSDEDDSDFGADSDDAGDDDDVEESRFAAGAETQLLMDQLQSSVRKWSGTPRAAHASSSSVASPHPPRTSSPAASLGSAAITPLSAPPSSSLKPLTTAAAAAAPAPAPPKKRPAIIANDVTIPHTGAPLRKPIHHPEPMDTQGLPLESQRVALATLQGFTPASPRTDILLPLSRGTLDNLLSGHQDGIVLPFKVPAQVVRFWLIHDDVLRYLACVAPASSAAAAAAGTAGTYDPAQDNGCGGHGTWTYAICQVYELNNPVQEEDMRAEDWIHGPITRYAYFPPAVVSQLLWNLRQALFADDADEEATAAVVALSSSPAPASAKRATATPARNHRRGQPPSSPLYARPPPSTMPAPPPRPRPLSAAKQHHTQPAAGFVRPSQATTVSQASTVDLSLTAAGAAVPRGDESSESLVFDDHGGSSIPMPYSVVSSLEHLQASQLLTRSQILPDSLVEDEEEQQQEEAEGEKQDGPDEIWDSEDE